MKTRILFTLFFGFFVSLTAFSQSAIRKMIKEKTSEFQTEKISSPFTISELRASEGLVGNEVLEKKTYLNLDTEFNNTLIESKNENLVLKIPINSTTSHVLKLTKATITSPDFKLLLGSDKTKIVNYTLGAFYWGVVEGKENSLVAISVFKDEISGLISVGKETYTLTKLEDTGVHLIFKESDLKAKPSFNCYTDDVNHYIGSDIESRSAADANNCVRMYVEVDNDMYNEWGSTTATANYITAVFNQVAILYANEAVNFTLNTLVIWDTTDPYTGPGTSNYLNQFRDNLNGNYDGDLAHLVGTQGGGGIAYVDVLCNGFYGVAYSDINTTYADVPTYSWTVEVLTHEIGHNLGSPHTHACAWNGNNTALDGCGPEAGYSEGCDGPLPPSGTIMSYCHLVSGIGIDFNNGFGAQPGDLIRSNVYNAPCLTACTSCPNTGDICDDGDACTTGDVINSACNCVGTYTDADNDGFCVGNDPNDNDPCVPVACPDCTDVTLTIVLDNYPEETTWQITDSGGSVVASGGPYGSQADGSTVTASTCLEDGCYDFTIFDSYGDGICCSYGIGSYVLADNSGNTLASGGAFTTSETTNFCLGGGSGCTTVGDPCNDGDNCTVGETYDESCNCNGGSYVDNDGDGFCVGVDPDDNDPCNPDNSDPSCGDGSCTYVTVDNNNFEGGWGIWNDGGSDCRRSINDSNYAYSGNYCVRIRDNTSTSVATTDNLNLSGYSELTVSFTYYPRSMDNSNEDFWLQVSTNGGGSYSTVEEWNRGDEFQNNVREFDSVVIPGPFTNNTRLRFRCDASANSDWIYLDDIVIEGCSAPSIPEGTVELQAQEISVFPNPSSADNDLRIQATRSDQIERLSIYNTTGTLMTARAWNKEVSTETVSLENFGQGSYILSLQTQTGVVTKKFIVLDR